MDDNNNTKGIYDWLKEVQNNFNVDYMKANIKELVKKYSNVYSQLVYISQLVG